MWTFIILVNNQMVFHLWIFMNTCSTTALFECKMQPTLHDSDLQILHPSYHPNTSNMSWYSSPFSKLKHCKPYLRIYLRIPQSFHGHNFNWIASNFSTLKQLSLPLMPPTAHFLWIGINSYQLYSEEFCQDITCSYCVCTVFLNPCGVNSGSNLLFHVHSRLTAIADRTKSLIEVYLWMCKILLIFYNQRNSINVAPRPPAIGHSAVKNFWWEPCTSNGQNSENVYHIEWFYPTASTNNIMTQGMAYGCTSISVIAQVGFSACDLRSVRFLLTFILNHCAIECTLWNSLGLRLDFSLKSVMMALSGF